ncbi:ATPase, AAA family [Aciduliprofundum boonei T469]|nr:ATPase, AAA family [Aciduliprofundum boonei T469]
MENQKVIDDIEEAIEKLMTHELFNEAFQNEMLPKLNTFKNDKEYVYSTYGEKFRDVNSLDDNTLKNLISNFLNNSENRHWTGMQWQKNKIIKNIDKLRKALVYAVEHHTDDDPIPMLKEFEKVPGISYGISTPILHVMYPERFCPLNEKTYNALIITGVYNTLNLSTTNRGTPKKDGIKDYPKINEFSKKLVEKIREKYNLDETFSLWEVDALWHFINEAKKKSASGCYLEIIKVPRKRATIDVYKETLIGKYLWCPNTKEYVNGEKGVMEKVKPEDIIIHDWDGIIYGYSIVEKEPESVSKEDLIKIFENERFLNDSYKEAIEKYTSKNIKGFYIVKLKNFSRFEKEFRYSEVEGLPEQQNLQRLRGKYLLELDKDVCEYFGIMQDGPPKEIQFEKEIGTLLNAKNQVILYGPPGTGKTWIARNYALNGVGENNDRVAFVTFHPSFSYEDFVESIKPNADEDELRFRIEEGIFKRIARNAYNALLEYAGVHVSKRWDANGELPDLEDEERNKVKDVLDKEDFPKFYIIIDEINRGDVSKIFGELITLLEKDKRLFMENEMIVRLPYSKKKFGVPPNLYIIGTMNTADRSIALMDVALRRRFAFLEIMPSYTVLLKYLGISNVNKEDDAVKEIKDWKGDDLRDIKKLAIKALYTINEEIKKNYDRDHQIGHSYYLQLKDATTEDELKSKLKYIWLYEILPLLQEYFYGSNENLEKILYPCNKSGNVENDVIGCYKRDIMREDNSWSVAKFFDAIINHKKPSEKNE